MTDEKYADLIPYVLAPELSSTSPITFRQVEWRRLKKVVVDEDNVSKLVTIHTRVGKPERVCLDFGNGQFEGLGNVVYTFIDDVLRDADGEVIDYNNVNEDGRVIDNLPVTLTKYMVAIDTAAAEDDRVPLLVTRVGRKWAYTRPVNNPVRGKETKWTIAELLLMVHDFLRSSVTLTEVFVGSSWYDAVGIDVDSVDGATRYYFADGTMLDVADADRDRLVREPDPETDSVEGDVNPNPECEYNRDLDSGMSDEIDNNDSHNGNRGVSDDDENENNSIIAPKVCGVLDQCTQSLMDDGGSVCSLSGSDDDLWIP